MAYSNKKPSPVRLEPQEIPLLASPSLSSGPLRSPRSPRSPWLGSPSLPAYKEKGDDDAYFDPSASPHLPLPVVTHNTTRRSRTRLLFLSLLAVAAIIGIATWQAPEHIKAKAAGYVSSIKESASKEWEAVDTTEWENIWDSAKHWSGISNEELTDAAKDDDDQVADISEEQIPASELDADASKQDDAGKTSDQAEETEEPVVPTAEPEVHPLYVLPNPPRKPSNDPNEKFLSYLPHSGYHNQRIELVNSMMLAYSMNRTLLVPPVWVGWPMTTQPFRPMQRTWNTQMQIHSESFTPKANLAKRQATPKMTEDQCKSYAKECRNTYKDTFLSWDFLVNLNLPARILPLVDRFNMTREYLHELVGVQDVKKDVYLLEDLDKYYYHFHDTDHNETELLTEMKDSKYKYTVSIPRLVDATKDHKLLELGSMFGSGRMWMEEPRSVRRKGFFQRSMAFNNPVLNAPANQISKLMGGSDGYIGIHARVGDGWFMLNAVDNMRQVFLVLLERLGVPESAHASLLKAAEDRQAALKAASSSKIKRSSAKARHESIKRSLDAGESDWSDLDEFADEATTHTHSKRQVASGEGSSSVLGPIRRREELPLDSTLKCRGPLHTDEALLTLNNPVYLATDSRAPLVEPALQYFLVNFPCAFILSDFDRPNPQNTGEPVHSLKAMEGAVNENDGVKLGRLFLPFMEAMVASKAALTIGTSGSTFSGFAAGFLHDAYWRMDRKQGL